MAGFQDLVIGTFVRGYRSWVNKGLPGKVESEANVFYTEFALATSKTGWLA